jgi:hypothetical protein
LPIKGPQGANNLIQWLKWWIRWILEFSHFLLHCASDSTQTHYPGSEPTSLCSFLTLHALQRINKHQFQCLLVWPAQPQGSNTIHTQRLIKFMFKSQHSRLLILQCLPLSRLCAIHFRNLRPLSLSEPLTLWYTTRHIMNYH